MTTQLRPVEEVMKDFNNEAPTFPHQFVEHILTTDRDTAYTLLKTWIASKSAPKSNDPYSNEYEHGYDRAMYDMSILLDHIYGKTDALTK